MCREISHELTHHSLYPQTHEYLNACANTSLSNGRPGFRRQHLYLESLRVRATCSIVRINNNMYVSELRDSSVPRHRFHLLKLTPVYFTTPLHPIILTPAGSHLDKLDFLPFCHLHKKSIFA